jgi:hypothetical protein
VDPSPSALLALGILGFVPGFLLYRAFRPTGFVSESVAIAPALSFGFVFVLGEIVDLAGVPFAPLPFLVPLAVAAGVAGFRWWKRADRGRQPNSPAWSRPAAALLAGGMLLVAGSWVLGIRGLGTTPPYTDSSNHGLMAAQVATHESLDPGTVLGSDAAQVAGPGETAYYPLALHGEVALAHRFFGIGFADGLLAATLLFSVFVLPLGLFLAVRRLVPDNPLLAGVAALLGATIGFFPVLPLSFGGLPLVVGLAMVPAVAVTAERYLTGAGSLPDAGIVAFGTVGILATHTSEVPLLALFVVPVLAEAVLRHRVRLAILVRRLAVLGAACVLLTAPTLPLIAGGTAERAGIDEGRTASLGDALSALRAVVGGGGADVVAVLALVGVGLCLRRRRHLPVVATMAIILGLDAVASGVHGPLRVLTVPWYQHPGRIAMNLVLLIPFFAALTLVELVPSLWARGRQRADGLVPGVLVAVALAFAGFATGATDMRTLFHERVVVGADAKAAFAYLRTVVQPGDRVLNDANTDGSMWMYPFEGVVPLLGLRPARSTPSWEERVWLIENLPAIDRDPRVRELLRTYDVRHVYFNDRTFSRNPHHVDGEALRNTAAFCPRFSRGTVRIYEIVGPSDCPTPT